MKGNNLFVCVSVFFAKLFFFSSGMSIAASLFVYLFVYLFLFNCFPKYENPDFDICLTCSPLFLACKDGINVFQRGEMGDL